MARAAKSLYECGECGAQSPKWLGRCAECGAWNTLVESVARPPSRAGERPAEARVPQALSAVTAERVPRVSTALPELDRVLGGGLVRGGVVLIGGDPGIGKSTLLLQSLIGMAASGRRVLYASGEESAAQVALRARRLSSGVGKRGALGEGDVQLLSTTELADVVAALAGAHYDAVVVDSIQTLRAGELQSAPGSVAQLREVSARLIELAKARDTPLWVIGHVTKDGALAGPKVLEHLVDVVLSFEGDPTHTYRLVRGQKNRFGATHEVAVFEMASEGLREVAEPSALFLSERPDRAPGSAVAATAEGSRPMLVEVQALVCPAQFGAPRRVATGLDHNRLAVLLAVLQRKASVHVIDQDVFASVAGGLRVDEPAVDLACCCAIVSALRERPLSPGVIAFGEVGLTGELRAVPRAALRVSEAKKLGFTRVVLPAGNAEALSKAEREGIELSPATRLDDALHALF
jgi:DNA repair protein RadA/Sms